MAKKSFEFTLILSGIAKLTRRVEDALYEAGCDDALLGSRNGVVFLDFDREATSFEAAIAGAIRDVQKANIGAAVQRIEPDNLVNQAEIARRIRQSRESVRKYIQGERGKGAFPPPVSIKGTAPVWRWNEVAAWFAAQGTITPELAAQATYLATANNLLDLQRNPAEAKRLISSGAFLALGAAKKSRKKKLRRVLSG